MKIYVLNNIRRHINENQAVEDYKDATMNYLAKKYGTNKNIVYHGSNDITYFKKVSDIDTLKNTRNAKSKYFFVNNKPSVAINYAKKHNGFDEYSGILVFKLSGRGYTIKNSDIPIAFKSMNDFELFLDNKKDMGFDFVRIPQDGNNIAVLNMNVLKFKEKINIINKINEFATRELKRIGMGAEGHVFSTGNYAIKKIIANKMNTQKEMVRLYGLNKALQKLHHPHLADILDIKVEQDEGGKMKAIEILKEKLEKLNPEEFFHLNDLTLLLTQIGVRRNLKKLKDKIVYDKVANNINSVGNENIRKNLWGVIDASFFLLNNNMDKYFWKGEYDLNSKNVMKDAEGIWKIVDF